MGIIAKYLTCKRVLTSLFFVLLISCFLCFAVYAEKKDCFEEALTTSNFWKVKKYINNNPELVNKKFDYGWTPLHLAARNADFEITEFLLKKGADINQMDESSNSPLRSGIMSGDVKFVEYLLSKGAVIYPKVRIGDNDLLDTCLEHQFADIFILLFNRADEEVLSSKELHWLLICAYSKNNEERVIELIKDRFILDSGSPCFNSIADEAVSWGDEEMVEKVIKAGWDPNRRYGNEKLPLTKAVEGRNLRLVKLLIDNGALVNGKGSTGATPIWAAIYLSKFDTADYLISRGASLNTADDEGKLITENIIKILPVKHPSAQRKKMLKYIFSKGGFISPKYLLLVLLNGRWDLLFLILSRCRYYAFPLFFIVMIILFIIFYKSGKKSVEYSQDTTD